MIQFTTKVVGSGADSWRTSPTICLVKPKALETAIAVLLEQAEAKCAAYVAVRLDLPHRPRSTGPRSQNSRFWGHCEDLAEQVYGDVRAKQRVHDGMLRMAVSEGYPTYLDINGVESPLPSAESSVEQLSLVCRVLQRYADTHNLWLHEYITEGPLKGRVYKSVGGRSYEEMLRYAAQHYAKGLEILEDAADLGVRLQEGEE